MNTSISNHPILFLDIETVPAYSQYEDLPDKFKKLWNKKAKFLKSDQAQSAQELYGRAGIYAEFGKIVCISTGYFHDGKLRLKSYYNHDEKQLLHDFAQMLNKHFNNLNCKLCAHNGKEFDFPYIARRMLINGIRLPLLLNMAGLKPWEVPHIDTLEFWKFGDYKNYTSLELLAAVFDIPTPKDDIDGSMVGQVYYKQNDLNRIKIYCEKDVITIVQLYRKYHLQELIADEQIIIID
ncbi:MAG: 3'-5' exonuclease [Bacteroidales bacterium]|nr:3'-5' exonuclease [Bacteroidales bacterium]